MCSTIAEQRREFDLTLDMIPIVSTINGGVNALEKGCIEIYDRIIGKQKQSPYIHTDLEYHSYAEYLRGKPWSYIGKTMIPFYGNFYACMEK